MDYKYFDGVIEKIIELKNQGIIEFSIDEIENIEELNLWNLFPEDFKYYLNKLGLIGISMNGCQLITTIVEEIESGEVFWDWVGESLKYDSSIIFVIRNVDAAHYAYHLSENPIKIHEYCFSDGIYNNIFEIIEEQVIKRAEEWKRIVSSDSY